MRNIKLNLGLKIPLIIALSVIFLTVAGTISGYSSLRNMINRTTGENFSRMAAVMASSVASAVDKEMDAAISAAHDNTLIAGDGKACLGDITLDKSRNVWCIPFMAPVKDKTGAVIGINRVLVDISVLSKPLENFKIGRTGNAFLVDSKGYLVYYPHALPFANKFCDYKELQRAREEKSGGLILHTAYLHTPEAFAASAEVASPLLTQKGIEWSIFVVQDASEVFEPLAAFVGRMALFSVLIIIAMSIAAIIIFGGAFAGPMRELQEGFEHLARGDLDYRVEIKTGDEIEHLAESYNTMREGLKKVTTSVSSLEKEAQAHEKADYRANALSADVSSETARLREEFKAISDELKSLIGQTSGRSGDKQRNATEALEAHMDRLTKTLNELADIAAIERGKIELNIAPFDFRAMIRDAVFVWEPKIREKGLDLKLDMPTDKMTISADETRLKQVFLCILEGALKFTEKGYIEISVKELKNYIECSIIDTGMGIPRDAISGVFERAERPSDIPGRKSRGGGIGLFIAKGVTEAHKGKITVESELGKKTKFTFILPKNS